MERKASGREEGVLQLVTFHVGKEEFGVGILEVREINRMVEITPLPQAPEFVEGIINLRGRIIPVVDLRSRFGLEASRHDKDSRIVIVELGPKVVGFMVDSVKQVLRVSPSLVEPPPSIAGGTGADYVRGVVKLEDRLLILLDLQKLLSREEAGQFQTLAA